MDVWLDPQRGQRTSSWYLKARRKSDQEEVGVVSQVSFSVYPNVVTRPIVEQVFDAFVDGLHRGAVGVQVVQPFAGVGGVNGGVSGRYSCNLAP